MGPKHYIPDLMPADLEDTADYPPVSAPAPALTPATVPLQVADTWVMPKLEQPQPPPAATAPAPVPEDLLRPYVEESAKLRAEVSALSADRDELRQQLEQRTAANRELAAELEARTAQLRTADAGRAELHARFESAQAELTAQAQQRERQAASQSEAERERAHRETALARSQEELTELHRRVAGHCEALRAVEGQRQLYDSMLREREDMIDQADARARAAEARAQEAERLHKPEPDLELPRRIAALEAQLEESRAEARTLADQLRSEQESAVALRAELEARSVAGAEAVVEPAPEQALVPAPEATPDPGQTAVPVPEVTRLLVRTTGDTGIVHKLGRHTTIGRTPDNDLRIDEDFISRRHAVILASADSAIVEDLNSTNGVFVNGERVSRHELREGELLTIGQTSFRYVLKPAIGQD